MGKLNTDSGKQKEAASKGKFEHLTNTFKRWYEYVTEGVWSDPRDTLGVRIVKTLNLTMNAFFNSTLQVRSMSLTYSTVLSIVPAFALLVAIGRGFGLQDLLQEQLYQMFPAQGKGIGTAMTFVDSYLKSTTQGVFVGVGIVVLLWTVVSLLSSIEDTFNTIWGISKSRTLYQKITDYIAICLLIPVLMICSSGVSIVMTSILRTDLNLPFLTPLVDLGLEFVPWILAWLAFTLSYYLIPNTKVNFKYAAIAGALATVAFEILQLLFLNGQIYVSKYNAIYGSFAFLPLMLIWLQLSWLLLLTGCMIAYSMQNVFTFNLMGDESAISNCGWHNVALIIMAIASQRFSARKPPLTVQEIAVEYYLPIRIVGRIVEKLRAAKLVYDVQIAEDRFGISPAVEVEGFTVGQFLKEFDDVGVTDFMIEFKEIYSAYNAEIMPLWEEAYKCFDEVLVKDIALPAPGDIKEIMMRYVK